MAISPLFNIGTSALNATSACISTTGNNIANVDTEGYNRQYVRLEDAYSLDKRPGAQGQGVNATEIMRRFNKFLEKAYLGKSSAASRWDQQSTLMSTVQSLFNESNRTGVSSMMSTFFNAWQDLAARPSDSATRQSLLSNADNLSQLINSTSERLKKYQSQMDESIRDQVNKANDLIKSIADLNKQIDAHSVPGVSNPNMLLDKRDLLVRQLSEIVDVNVNDRGAGDYTVSTANGYPLVNGSETYSLEVQGPQVEALRRPESTYKGNLVYEGTDSHEYTVEVIRGGNAPADAPQIRVSLDGGKTWLMDENGDEARYTLTDFDSDGKTDPIRVGNLTLSFDDVNDFYAGDTFTVVPKSGLYWVEPTRGPVNITPQVGFNGMDNTNRLTGGKLAALYNVRDDNCGRYLDELDALSRSLIWETNRLHSQGAGLEKLSYAQGTYSVYKNATNIPLSMAQSGLTFGSKLTSGNIMFNIYDATTGNYISSGPLDFTGLGNPPSTSGNFDPAAHSLEDVVAAINKTYGAGTPAQLTASIQDGKLLIESDVSVNFALGADTTGLMAGLGINTFFTGNGADDIAVRDELHTNLNLVNAGAVNGAHEANPGDMSTAESIAALANKAVSISTGWKVSTGQTLSEYFNATVSTVGADTRTAQTNAEYNIALATDLDHQVASLGGVNIDEEMSNLIKFQHSYTAAAKLITTADEMLQTLLGLKQ
ncbi:MAG: flagellar hook-associated protein FlgK [Desulfovibrionaceae bacterium]|nr:flagellar hook-associated protein FlgK [Desulfovibrionaceae bacterium]